MASSKPEVVSDRGTIGVFCVYVAQAIGNVTPKEIKEVLLTKEGFSVNIRQIRAACEDLKRRKILSVLQRPNADTGEMETAFGIRDVQFTSSPEMGQLKAVLPTFLESDEAKRIKNVMHEKEAKGEKKDQSPKYCQYRGIQAKFTNTSLILGSNPDEEEHEEPAGEVNEEGDGAFNGKKAEKVQATRRLYRDPNDSEKVVLLSSWFRCWLANHMRKIGFNEVVASYIGVSCDSFKPRQAIVQKLQGCAPRKGKSGVVNKYEALLPGEEWWVTFEFPTKGFMSVKEFINFLARISVAPVVGIGGYYRQYGRIKMVDFKVLDDLSDVGNLKSHLQAVGETKLVELMERAGSLQ